MTIQFDQSVFKFTTPMMRGPSVLAIQRALIQAGHLEPDSDDGLYGSATRAAVRKFQQSKGLGVDGCVGEKAARALNAVLGATGTTAAAPAAKVATGLPEVVDPSLLPRANPKRVILHWTGGNGRASEIERSHYHFLIEEDGTVVPGKHRIDANDRPHPATRAEHVRMLNTHSIGVSLCGMFRASENPFDPGSFPLRKIQVDVMARLVAQICSHYGIPVTTQTVLGHGEVQRILGVKQMNKWDPLALPWRRDLSLSETGDYLRSRIQTVLTGEVEESATEESLVTLRNLTLLGKIVPDGITLFDTGTWVRLSPTADALGWPAPILMGNVDDAAGVMMVSDDRPIVLPHRMIPTTEGQDEEICIRVEDLAERLELGIAVDPNGHVVLRGEIGGVAAPTDGKPLAHFVTVERGDTLSRIARRELGDAGRWRELRDEAGARFTEESARRVRAGQRVMLPGPATSPRPTPRPVGGLTDEHLKAAGKAIAAVADRGVQSHARSAVPAILAACYQQGVTDLSHIAYVLATAQHESKFGKFMKEIWGPTSWQKNYEGHKLNEKPGDGSRYCGRGFTQLTFRHNYRRYGAALKHDLEDNPELATKPEIAAQIMVYGMSQNGFTGPRQTLQRYGSGDEFDFVGARALINGDVSKNGPPIARSARKFRDALAVLELPKPA